MTQQPSVRLTWVKASRGDAASCVASGTPTRVRIPTAMPRSAQIDIWVIPEPAIARLLVKVGRRPGRYVTSLRRDQAACSGAAGGLVSECWVAPHLGLGASATRYVATAEGMGRSGPLYVVQKVLIATKGWQARASIDPVAIATPGATGVATLDVRNGEREMTWEIAAPVDPALEIRVLLPLAEGRDSLRAYLDEYLPGEASLFFEDDAATFPRLFLDEYWDYLENIPDMHPAPPTRLELDEGATAVLTAVPHPKRPGKTATAVAALDPKTGDRIAVSDLVGLTVRGVDHEIVCDF